MKNVIVGSGSDRLKSTFLNFFKQKVEVFFLTMTILFFYENKQSSYVPIIALSPNIGTFFLFYYMTLKKFPSCHF